MGWEEGIMRVGDGCLPVVETSDGRFATAICYDAHFPEFIRQAGRSSADLLIVPQKTGKRSRQHSNMAAFRAIENGVPLVRATASGSSAFDPWGRVLSVADYFAEGERTMNAQVPVAESQRYTREQVTCLRGSVSSGLVLALGVAALAPV